MKHGGFKAVCLAIAVSMTVGSVFAAEEKAVNLESRILENFDGSSGYIWKVSASKFATKTDQETFPKLAYINTWPAAIHGYNQDANKDLKSLGIWGRFDRKGYNWIDIYPVAKDDTDENPTEIPFPGRIQLLDMWVWGANFNYYLEAYVRDYTGVVHIINMGDLNFEGWKNLRVNIPSNIPQEKRTLPKRQSLSLVKFRIWTRPVERVDDFQVYIHQIKVLTDTFENLFDGDELADPARMQQLWSAGSNANN